MRKGPGDNPLYVFLHTPKCAGTTLTYHFRQHLAPDEMLALYLAAPGLYHDPTTGRQETLRTWEEIDERLSALTPEHRGRVRVIYGHDAFIGLERWFGDRNVRYFTFLRDPVELLLSWYKMFRRILERRGTLERFRLEASGLQDDHGQVRPFRDWFLATEALYPALAHNNMTRHFGHRFLRDPSPHRIYGPAQLETCKAALETCCRVGTVRTFSRHAEELCRELGLPLTLVNRNYSPKYATVEELGDFVDVIRRCNRLDTALYEHAVRLDPLADAVQRT